jgi:hypothetical protein
MKGATHELAVNDTAGPIAGTYENVESLARPKHSRASLMCGLWCLGNRRGIHARPTSDLPLLRAPHEHRRLPQRSRLGGPDWQPFSNPATRRCAVKNRTAPVAWRMGTLARPNELGEPGGVSPMGLVLISRNALAPGSYTRTTTNRTLARSGSSSHPSKRVPLDVSHRTGADVRESPTANAGRRVA